MEKIKILYLVDTISGPNGGTERQILELMNSLNPDRFQMTLGCLFNSPWLKRNPPPGSILMLNFKGYWHPNFLWQIIRLVRFIRNERIQILQTFFLEANIIGIIAAGLGGVPVRIASRRNLGHRYTFFKKLLLKFLKSYTTFYVANCRKVAQVVEQTERVPQAKIKVVYNGVDTNRFKPTPSKLKNLVGLPNDKLIVGMVANLKKLKGIDYFLRAAKIISEKHKHVLFVIIGGEYDEKLYLKMRDRIGLREIVLFLGIQEKVENYLNAFDIAVNSSLTEGFSNSILEYMACGLPVVATDAGGNAEAVLNGETGIIIHPRDSEKLACAIETLLHDQDLRYRMGENGRRRILENFTQGKMLAGLELLYLELVNVHKN